jgi:hypothetical protein
MGLNVPEAGPAVICSVLYRFQLEFWTYKPASNRVTPAKSLPQRKRGAWVHEVIGAAG